MEMCVPKISSWPVRALTVKLAHSSSLVTLESLSLYCQGKVSCPVQAGGLVGREEGLDWVRLPCREGVSK